MDLSLVTKLRKTTQAGITDCKMALEEAKGDFDKAIGILRKQGEAKAVKKLDTREAKEGLVYSYIHANGKIGSLLVLSSETDFVARNKEFKELAHDLAMQVVAMQPKYLKPEDVPADEIAGEREIYTEQLKKEGKKEEIIEKIVDGKLKKYYEEVCLLNQDFIKNEDIKVDELIKEKIATLGEKIEVVKFCFYKV